jgi:hypothetical protein
MNGRLGIRTTLAIGSLIASLYGCGSTAEVGDAAPGGGPGAENGPGFGPGSPGAPGDKAPGGSGDFCSGSGGILLPGTTECTGDVAQKLFRFAVCTCDPLAVNGQVHTESFDSSTKQSGGTGASIGTNGTFSANGALTIGGSLWAAGRIGVTASGTIEQDLHAGNGVGSTGLLRVMHDLYAPAPAPTVQVGGVSHVPATVAPPCGCQEQVPIASYVKAFATNNDDAASGLTPASLSNVDAAVDVTLPCGKYYFDDISGNAGVHITLQGRTAIFIAGDIAPNGALSFSFAPGAELDLFVAGDIRLNGAAALGNTEEPARARFYVAGTEVGVNGTMRLAGNLYAPNAIVRLNGTQATRGSVIAKGLAQNGSLSIAYDEAILQVQGCEAPGGGCASCRDCAGATPACKGGKCGACETNGDCCAPLLCQGGTCVPALR